jgi:uncharacterized membrane protein
VGSPEPYGRENRRLEALVQRDRLTAFSDGVIAVIITIMVLEMRPPHGSDLRALLGLGPMLMSYVLSFVYVAIYWNNHHHFFQLVDKVNGAILWANLHLLFWLSLIPFATTWVGANPTAPAPTAAYGVALLMPALAWSVMQQAIIRSQGKTSALARVLGADVKGKISPFLYVAGVGLSFVNTRVADALYAGVALLWLIPDRRVEAAFERETPH